MDLNEGSKDSGPAFHQLPAKSKEQREQMDVALALVEVPQTEVSGNCRQGVTTEPEAAKDLSGRGDLALKADSGAHQSKIRMEGSKLPSADDPPAKRMKLDTLEESQGSKNTVVSETAALPSDLKPPQTHTREVQDDVKEAAEGCQNQAKKIKAGAALPCPSCNFMAKNKIALKIHTKQHHFNDIYLVCDICNVTSPSEESHRKHLSSVLHKKLTKSTRESTGTKEGFNCRLCGQLLPSRYDLDKHIKENHSKRSKAHVCPQCKYKAESGASLQAHLKHKHVQKERLSCDLCGFRCYDENLLKTHCRGKTHLRRKNLAARGGYIHLLSKKRLPAESSARGKVERAKCINDDSPSLRKKPKNLGRAKNKSTTQKNNRSAKCLEKSKNPGNDHCEEAPSSKADERVQLNDSRAGKASPQRTSRRVKEPTDLLQERVGKQRLKRSDEGSVSSLRPRSGRCTDNTERVRHTRSEGRLSQEEVGNQRAPRNLRGRGSLLTMDNSRGRGRHPGRSTVIPDVQCGRGKLPGKKNQGVKSKCKISGATDQLDGKPENQGERGDADSSNRTEANLENEKSSKTSCQSGNEEGETAMQVVLQEPTLVKNSTDNVSQVQNLVSPTTNPADNKTPNLENPESKLSPADRKALRTCSYCGHVFQNRKGLEVHIKRRHTKEMDFHCQPCGYACVTKGDFEKHCQSNRHQLNFSQIDCQLCAFVTLDEGALKEHMSQEHKMAFYCSACRLHFASEEDLVDHEGSEQHTRRVLPQQKEKALEQIENQQPREENQSKITSDGNGEPTVPRSGLSLKDPQKPSIARVIAGNILRRSTHSRLQLQCKSCFYKARSATVLLKHIRLRHAQEYRFLCKVCSLYTISREAMEKHIKRSRHIENAKKRNLGPSLEECVEEVSIGVQDVQKIIKTTGALGNVNSEIDKGCVQVLEPSKSKEEFVVTWEISEGDATNVENVQKDNDLPSAEGIKKERPKGNISRTCPHCGLLASSVTNLNIHIRRKHSHQYSYFCKACNYYTVTKGDMDRHCNTKKHKNRADVSKPVEICRKAAMPNNKDNPQMVGTDSPALPTADCVESNSSVSEPEIPEKEGQSGVLENCTHVNLESVLSVQNEQHMDEQKGTEAILEVEPNSTGQDGGSSSSKRLKGNHATTCAYCGFVAYSQATLELHVKRKHTKDFDYYCMACDYYAVTRREMMRHAFTEKHKLKSQSYLKLNQGKGQPAMRGSITATNASKDGNQKEGSEDYPLKVRRDEGEKASEITLEATQESALCTEPKRMPESNEVTNDYKETTAVFELTETEEKSFQNEIANQGGLIETVPTVHNSENFAEVGSGMLDVNTACPGAKSPSVDLNSVSVKSAELENSQDQVADAPTEGNSSRCINIVTMQKTSMASNDADLNVEASQTGEVDDLQGSHQGDERPKDDKPTKEIANLGSRPYEIVDPNGNMSNCSGLAEDVSVQVEPSALPGGSEGNTTEQNADGHPNVTGLQQPEKNSDHVQVNLVQQVEGSYEDTAATATTEVPGQNHADREQVIGADEAQDKGDAALREKTRDVKNANEVRQDLEGDTVEAAESSSDDLRKMEFQGSKPFRCTLCNFATAQLGDARNHVKRHLGVREYKCHICGWAFVMKKHLSTHLLGKHGIGTPKERKFVCEICDRTFTEKWALTNHKKLHMGQKPFKCPWLTCHYSFLTASAMRDHFRTHTGEKSFLCDLCRFAGGTRHALTKHRRQHTGEKPFKCDQCNFASTTQSHLTRHRRVHTGEKPYKCPWCDYRSNCAENIRKHILHTGKHEGVLMYNCPKCEYGTNIPLEFRNHLKELHPDIENPDLAYLHAGIVSKAYECRLKGQGAQFVETAVPFNTPPSSDSTEVVGNSVNGCVQQQEQTESIGQVIIIQGYQDSYGEAVPIDASVEATAAATLQTLAMAGQMAQVAEVVHITEDGQLIATAQTASHEGGMMPGQILSRHLASGTTQVVVVESPVGGGDAGEAAVTMETLGDPSHVIEQVVTQEESAGQPADTPTALDALLCAITELGAVEVRSSEQGGHEPVQEEPGVAESALEEVTSVPSEPQSSHKEQVADEVTRAAGVAPEVEQPAAVTTAQTVPQASFSDMVQEVLQFTMCDIRTASHIVKDGITQVIVTKEGAAHMVEGASQIIMQEGEEQTITTSGHPVQLIDSDGSISQLIVTEEIAQAMVQEATAHMSDQATHVIVTELPHGMVNSVDSGAVTEVYPHGVMELMAEGVSTLGHPVTTIALTECYTEGRSEIVMTELPAGEEQEMEVGGNQEA
ncbi:zinc finger protein 407 isoform X2 [Pristis pectinata]|uniref:zinc finger protein 407 isoform X2 n=1 Tax=Pristis pectinata TaxID=685728 RepID=UPI00223D4645|nr:zinc finger protein 407 isoform X2 [Pristis pectinata]